MFTPEFAILLNRGPYAARRKSQASISANSFGTIERREAGCPCLTRTSRAFSKLGPVPVSLEPQKASRRMQL